MTRPHPCPADFAEQAAKLHNKGLMAHYGVGLNSVIRWRAETGAPVLVHPASEPSPVPADWYEVAPGKSQRQLKTIYGCSRDTVIRWIKQTNVVTNGTPYRTPLRPCPADFAERWQEMSHVELMAHYVCGKAVVIRWTEECGLHRTSSARVVCRKPRKARVARVAPAKRPPAQLKAYHKAAPSTPRDGSRASQAADYLRRFGPVVRCDASGRYAENGSYWRRGSTVLNADEVIERAVRNGWQPDVWMQVAA